MIIVNFPAGINEVIIPALNQWDYGQKIAIHGLNLPQITEVHFCDKSCDKALVRLASKIIDDVAGDKSHSEVTIPDALLENAYPIHAFIFVKSYESAPGVTGTTEGTFYKKSGDNYTAVTLPGAYVAGTEYYRECGKVTYKITIPVNARTQPDGYPCDDASVQNFLSEALTSINAAAAVLEAEAAKGAKIYNIKDGLYYDTWMGSKEEYEALSQEQKDAINTLFIYDNGLVEKLQSGEFVVANAFNAGKAETTDFTHGKWTSIKTNAEAFLSTQLFTESGTYQIKINGAPLPLADINISSTGDDVSICGIRYLGTENGTTAISFYQVTITKDGKIVDDKSYVAQLIILSDETKTTHTTLKNLLSTQNCNFEYRRIE